MLLPLSSSVGFLGDGLLKDGFKMFSTAKITPFLIHVCRVLQYCSLIFFCKVCDRRFMVLKTDLILATSIPTESTPVTAPSLLIEINQPRNKKKQRWFLWRHCGDLPFFSFKTTSGLGIFGRRICFSRGEFFYIHFQQMPKTLCVTVSRLVCFFVGVGAFTVCVL